MSPAAPLSALMSRTLVAFTIELDNEFEQRMPHRTTRQRGGAVRVSGPWLPSFAAWANFLRFVGDDGITVRELSGRPGVPRWAFDGTRRWGYVTIAPAPDDERSKPPKGELQVSLRPAGRRAAAIWPELPVVIETRWRERFGRDAVIALRGPLEAILAQVNEDLPRYLVGGGYKMFAGGDQAASRARGHERARPSSEGRSTPPEVLDLSALLSQALLVFARDYESGRRVALALNANVLRILTEEGVPTRELPRRAGVAKEIMNVMVGRLEKWGYVVVEPDPAVARGKRVRLTPQGRKAQLSYPGRVATVEAEWRGRFGAGPVSSLRQALERLVEPAGGERSPLWKGLKPPPTGWRATVREPECLPDYPLVTHRGGYPDGS
jgi:DNA-binding MarR family transcriptional regulator